jgi:ADP-ribosylglycohydrolase
MGGAPLVFHGDRDRPAFDALVGLAVGDAIGARFEGQGPDPVRLVVPLDPPDPPARWTDDTQMALGVMEVLLAQGSIVEDRLAEAFARRYEPWRGYGTAMHRILPRIREGEPWHALTQDVFPGGSFGNGAAMRVAPLGAFFCEDAAELVVSEADRSASVTHAHPEGRAGAVAVALAAWLAAASRGGPAPDARESLTAVHRRLGHQLQVARRVALAVDLDGDAHGRLGPNWPPTAQETVPLGLWIALRHLDDYETAVRTALAVGGDTDTLAAIVGGIVAARTGAAAIPEAWRLATEPLPAVLE